MMKTMLEIMKQKSLIIKEMDYLESVMTDSDYIEESDNFHRYYNLRDELNGLLRLEGPYTEPLSDDLKEQLGKMNGKRVYYDNNGYKNHYYVNMYSIKHTEGLDKEESIQYSVDYNPCYIDLPEEPYYGYRGESFIDEDGQKRGYWYLSDKHKYSKPNGIGYFKKKKSA